MTTHPVFLPRESHGQRKLAGYSPWSRKNVRQYWGNNITFHSNFASDFSESTFIFCPQEPRKPECWSHFHSLGLLRISWIPDTPCPVILHHLLRHCAGETGHDLNYQDKSLLHTPMYYFLRHLSFADLCYSTVITSKLLENLIVEDRTISFIGYIIQFFFACIFVVTEIFLLAVTAYDWFVAVCNPLLYTVVMSQKLCSLLAGAHTLGIQSVPWLLPTFYLNCPLEEIIS